MRHLFLLLMVVMLTGCGATSWFAGADVVEPSPLLDLDNEVQPKTLWSRSVGSGTDEQRLNLQPRVFDGAVFVADSDGEVQALSAENGSRLWSVDLDVPISGGPGAGEGLVLVGTSDAEVIALESGSGEERWRARVSSEVLSVPAIGSGVVVTHTVDGKLFGLESTNGDQRWQYEREVPVLTLRGSGSPVLSGGVAFVGMAGGKVIALRVDNGNLLWDVNVTIPGGRSELERLADIDGDPVVMHGGVFVATYQGEVGAIEQRSGRLAWQRKISSYSGMGADSEGLFVSDDEGVVWGLDPRSGNARWSQDSLKNRKLSNVVVLGGLVVVGDFEGYLHWMDRNDGRLVARTRVGSDPITTGLQVFDGTLYVLGDGGKLAAVRLPARP